MTLKTVKALKITHCRNHTSKKKRQKDPQIKYSTASCDRRRM